MTPPVGRDVHHDPETAEHDQQVRAAHGHQRQRHAGERQGSHRRADVETRLAGDDPRDAGRQQLAEQVLAVERDAEAHPGERRVQHQQDEQPDEPELLADDPGDHVGRLLGQEPELLHRVAETDSEHPARGDGDQRLRDLVPTALPVLPRVEEGDQALQPVRLGDDQEQHGDDAGRGETDQVAQRGARGDEDGGHGGHQDQRRPHVRLEHDQRRRRQDAHDREPQEAPQTEHLARASHDERRDQYDAGELGQFAGLYALPTEEDPAAGAVHRDADPRREHEHEAGQGQPGEG